MEGFEGIPSLFFACVELLLLVNSLIFAQKNKLNYIIFLLIALFASNHIIEFLICLVNINSSIIVLINFALVSLIPPLALGLVLKFWNHNSSLNYFLFFPSAVFIYSFAQFFEVFKVTECSYLYVVYQFPLRTELGVFFYTINIAAIIFLFYKLREIKLRYMRHMNKWLMIGQILAFVPPLIILLLFPSLEIYNESILNKFAFFYVLSLTYFSLKNKTELLSGKAN